jgi:hypothetical protein
MSNDFWNDPSEDDEDDLPFGDDDELIDDGDIEEFGADILCDCAHCNCNNSVRDYGELCRMCKAGEHN